MPLQTYPGLGFEGDFAKVRPGYARNFLVPQGFARLLDHFERKAWLDLQEVQHIPTHISTYVALNQCIYRWVRVSIFRSQHISNRTWLDLQEVKRFSTHISTNIALNQCIYRWVRVSISHVRTHTRWLYLHVACKICIYYVQVRPRVLFKKGSHAKGFFVNWRSPQQKLR